MNTQNQNSDECRPFVAPIDVEDLIFKCVPGGKTCDPQAVADNIREYCAAKIDQPAMHIAPDGTEWKTVETIETPDGVPLFDWLERWTPQIISDAWTNSVDMAGNRWTVSLRGGGYSQKFRGKTLIDAASKARDAFVLAHPNER